MQRGITDFERNNIVLVAISYDPIDVLAQFAAEHGITYPLLSDVGSKVIRDLGLLNHHLEAQHAAFGIATTDRHRNTPYPGLFVLNEQGVVVEKRFHQSYRDRETAANILISDFGVPDATHGREARAGSDGVSVRVYLDSDSYRSVQLLRLFAEFSIAPGLHVYSDPVPEGYNPLRVDVTPVDGLTIYPLEGPPTRRFQIEDWDEEFWVYEGTVRLSRTLAVSKKLDVPALQVTIQYQACSEIDCLMPEDFELVLPIEWNELIGRSRPVS